jgi:murein L,D-transpeptidase YcbB/YkuD
VPSSILRKEILPAIAKNSNYLAKHDMEWVDVALDKGQAQNAWVK